MAKTPAKKVGKKTAPKKAAVKKSVAKKTVVKRAPVKKVQAQKASVGSIHLKVVANGSTYETDTDEIARAVQDLKGPIGLLKTRVLMEFTAGGKTVEKAFNVIPARRLFINKMSADILESQVRLLLNVRG